jgi:hypothetical protein
MNDVRFHVRMHRSNFPSLMIPPSGCTAINDDQQLGYDASTQD